VKILVTGALYGHVLYPVHRIIFSGLVNELAARATKRRRDIASTSERRPGKVA